MKKYAILLIWISLVASGCALRREVPPAQALSKTEVKGPPPALSGDQERYFSYLSAQKYAAVGDFDRAILNLQKVIVQDPENGYLQRELALYYLQQKNSPAALAVLERLLEKLPDDPETLLLYGMASESVGKKDQAQEAYEKLIVADPKRETAYLRLGDIYLESEKLDDAFRVYSGLIAQLPNSYVGHFFLGKIHAFRKEYTQAEYFFKKTLELAPDLEEPKYELADLYKTTGKPQAAIPLYEEILADKPKDYRVAIDLFSLYRSGGKSAKADQVLDSIGREAYNDPSFFRMIGQDYLDEERYKEAAVILEGMLKGAPDPSNLSYLLGAALEGAGDKAGALLRYEQVTDSSKFYIPAVIQAAILHKEAGDLASGSALIQKAIEEHPQSPELYFYLGLFYEEENKLGEAEGILREGVKHDANSAQLHFRLGSVLDKLGKRSETIEEMKTVLRIDPNHVNALNYLGYTYAEMNINLDEAEAMIRTALRERPDDGYMTDSLGWVLFKQGRLDEAVAALEKAVRLVHEDPTILEHLGDVYLKMNQKKKALECYHRSLAVRKEDRALLEEKIKALKGEK